MSKKVLILEASVTVQKLFANTLSKNDYEFKFVKNGKNLINEIFDYIPDILLLNAEMNEPGSFELVKILRSIPCFQNLPIGMYVHAGVPFDEYFAQECGANTFVHLDEKTLLLNIEEFSQIPIKGDYNKNEVMIAKKAINSDKIFNFCTNMLKNDSAREVIQKKLFDMIKNFASMEDVAKSFLEVVANATEAPAVMMYIKENDGIHAYTICAKNFNEDNKSVFFKRCAEDFEALNPSVDISMLVPEYVNSQMDLDGYYVKNQELLAYEYKTILNSDKKPFGSVHIIRDTKFAQNQLDLLSYSVENVGILFENAIMIKRKLFFEKRIRKAFSKFVPKQIIDELVEKSDTNDKGSVGEKRNVAVLFTHIRNFNSISEKNKPEVLVAFLNRYFTLMCDIIQKYGGTIDKFMGDAIMAEFGMPVSYDDNCDRAVNAAAEMRIALDEMPLGNIVMPSDMEFSAGIGIHYGDLIVGSIGSKDKTDYSVIGDNVNLASRVEGLTKMFGVRIIVTESVKDECKKSHQAYRYLGDVSVKGKKTAVPIFAIDKSESDFSAEYKDYYQKGIELYKQGIFNLAKEYFEKALNLYPNDKSAKLVRDICVNCIANPPAKFDGAIIFNTK